MKRSKVIHLPWSEQSSDKGYIHLKRRKTFHIHLTKIVEKRFLWLQILSKFLIHPTFRPAAIVYITHKYTYSGIRYFSCTHLFRIAHLDRMPYKYARFYNFCSLRFQWTENILTSTLCSRQLTDSLRRIIVSSYHRMAFIRSFHMALTGNYNETI